MTQKEVRPMERLIGREELLRMVPYTLQHLMRLQAAGKFPARVRVGPNRVAWVASEVEAWIASRMTDRVGGTADRHVEEGRS